MVAHKQRNGEASNHEPIEDGKHSQHGTRGESERRDAPYKMATRVASTRPTRTAFTISCSGRTEPRPRTRILQRPLRDLHERVGRKFGPDLVEVVGLQVDVEDRGSHRGAGLRSTAVQLGRRY